ncbi:c-type cytochrome [Antarcticimicrobium luteum]|uniref:Cytochrome c n=1 Tax=Antarcticimicrobium luteum TaxID=2547397 RepID=A0A4R5V4T4_9RHOB|nr:cytochrome c [Antarcticimicrobium luteum]TDK46751.1 cytochrome c [Antarcticimicrobium luteum]
MKERIAGTGRIWKIGGIGVAALAAATLFWSQTGAEAQPGLLPYTDAKIVARGAEVYKGFCASCHGARLEGQKNWRERDAEGYLPAPPHDESGHTWHHPDKQLLALTWHGTAQLVGGGYISRMPGFKDTLSPDDVVAVLAYIKSTWPDAVIEQHNTINAQAGN